MFGVRWLNFGRIIKLRSFRRCVVMIKVSVMDFCNLVVDL